MLRKNPSYYLSLIFLIASLALIDANTLLSNQPKRPNNIPSDAKWDDHFKTWEKGDINKDYHLWYENGKIKLKITRINHKQYQINREENFFINGKLKKIGYEIYIDYLRDKLHGQVAGWQGLGKWREYYESGAIKREWCYTNILANDAYWTVAPCGVEIEYDQDGKIMKQINHKLKCEFDCDKYDPLKNSKFD